MTIATRQEYVGHALEAAIRSRVQDRAWYRANKLTHPWADLEAENTEALRLLLGIRREAIRQYRAETARVERTYRELMAERDAAMWSESLRSGRYVVDAGDHFVGRPS